MRKLPDGRVYDGATCEHVSPEEYERRKAAREEMAFQRRARQGELCAPMLISDSLGFRGLKSMASGQFYDSKKALRAEYRRLGYDEVGDQAPMKKAPRWQPDKRKALDAVDRALAQAGIPD